MSIIPRRTKVTIAAAGGKEAGDLVAKGGVVSVFHDGHQLNGVVSQFLDAGEDISGELCELTNTTLGRSNSDYKRWSEQQQK